MLPLHIPYTWHSDLEQYGLETITQTIQGESRPVFPPLSQIFSAFEHCSYERVKVVILGQDPYHGQGQANGLSFSVGKTLAIPPSLQNIYKELQADCGIAPPSHGELTAWAEQGVFLLNTCLSVVEGQANSHKDLGWEDFTDGVLSLLNQKPEPVVYLLWGAHSKKKARLLDNPGHLILTAPHPSPLSAYRGFLGCGHFSKANDFLLSQGQAPIQWAIT